MEQRYSHVKWDGKKQTVYEHLQGTAELCRKYAAAFGAPEQGYLTGLAHDIGKYSEEFQHRLLEQGPKVDHSTAGAYECIKAQQPFAAFCIAGHHAGLPDGGTRTDDADQSTFLGRMNRAAKSLLPDYQSWRSELALPDADIPKGLTGNLLSQDFYTRMLFSCLTDADFLDTEAFMSDGSAGRGLGETIEILTDKLDNYIADWFPPKNKLNEQRCAILKRCISQGEAPAVSPGLFSLTVPTGGGKTIASLAFALHHAKTHGKARVIYVIPYTSIIEQTADIFRSVLGENNVLEHHSGVIYDAEEATAETQQMQRATENWDKPIIVTTAVQFFESIYSNRSSACRKLHNIANSVIIFDEAQMLPIPYLRPCVSAISQLVANYGASAVLCTATQPALDSLFREFLPRHSITELCPPNVYAAELFCRVRFEVSGTLSWADLSEKMLAAPQSLCIVNTRKSAKLLFSLLSAADGTFHLSTLMVPAHRRAVITEIRQRLKNGLPCRVVSTSLIEAGVDIDFPMVFREISGLDSMLQAAGRCNREGKRSADESVVTLFSSESAVPQLFARNADIGKAILSSYDDISSGKAIAQYFEELLLLSGQEAQDKQHVLPLIESGSFPFATIAKLFHLIDTETHTVYIPWEKGKKLIARLQNGERSKQLFQETAQYSVSLYDQRFRELQAAGSIKEIGDGLWVLADDTLYSDDAGLSIQTENGKAIII